MVNLVFILLRLLSIGYALAFRNVRVVRIATHTNYYPTCDPTPSCTRLFGSQVSSSVRNQLERPKLGQVEVWSR